MADPLGMTLDSYISPTHLHTTVMSRIQASSLYVPPHFGVMASTIKMAYLEHNARQVSSRELNIQLIITCRGEHYTEKRKGVISKSEPSLADLDSL